MAVVYIPSLLRDLTHGEETVRLPGENLRQILSALNDAYPGTWYRLCTANGLRRSIAIAVDGQIASLGLLEPVEQTSEVHIVPAISGGCL